MSASYLGSSDLHSVILCDGAVILGESTDVRALGRVAQSLIVLNHTDIECLQRAVDEFASGLPNRRINEGLEWCPPASGISDVVTSMSEW